MSFPTITVKRGIATYSAGGACFASTTQTPNLLTTITLTNTSGSTLASGSVTQVMGCPFKKGDIVSGTWPKFQTTTGTAIKCTILNNLATYWADGSLKFVPVALMTPSAIAGSGTLTVNVLSGGTLPTASARSISDFTAGGNDPQVQVVGMDNRSGTWTANIAQAITDNIKSITYGNGDCGWFGKIRADFYQTGSPDGQLVCDYYLASLANNNGSFKGGRILGRIKLPYYNGTTPTKNWVSFSSMNLYADAGITLIRDCFGTNFGASRAATFTSGAGQNLTTTHGYSISFATDFGYAVRLTTTNTLPANFALNTTYFIGSFQGTAGSPSATIMTLSTNPSSYPSGGAQISAGGAGTGVHTWTPYPYLTYFGSLFTAGTTGAPDWMQGTGSDSADSTVRYSINQTYWLSTKLIPPYDLSIPTPTANGALVTPRVGAYWPNSAQPIYRALETTGERDDIGVIPSWYVRHFYNQLAADELLVRCCSLNAGHLAVGVESNVTETIPAVNNTTYSGMPAPNKTFVWKSAATGSSFGAGNSDTTVTTVQTAGWNTPDTSHMPQLNYYPYLFCGDAWHLDLLKEFANFAMMMRNPTTTTLAVSSTQWQFGTSGSGVRNLTVSGTTYNGGIIGLYLAGERLDAWALCLIGAAAGIIPASDPDCAGYSSYFPDLVTTTGNVQTAVIAALVGSTATYGANNGLWFAPWQANSVCAPPWMTAYHIGSMSLTSAINENSNVLAAATKACTWFDHVVGTLGGWHVGCYQDLVRTSDSEGGPLSVDDTSVAFHGPQMTWSSATGLFTNNGIPSNNTTDWTATLNDRVVFIDILATENPVCPAGFSLFTGYYVVNVSGNTFKLSATQGGSPIVLTDNYAGTTAFFIWWSAAPSTGSMTSMNSTGYNTMICNAMKFATALGGGPQAATLADVLARDVAFGVDFTSDPKWAMKTSFV